MLASPSSVSFSVDIPLLMLILMWLGLKLHLRGAVGNRVLSYKGSAKRGIPFLLYLKILKVSINTHILLVGLNIEFLCSILSVHCRSAT